MPKKTIQRKLELYHLHGHIGKGPIQDYSACLRTLANIEPEKRVLKKNDHIIVLSSCEEVRTGSFHLIAHEGEPGLGPLILNLDRFNERSSRIGTNELLSTRTHCVIDGTKRHAAVEFNQRGVKAEDLANLIRSVLEPEFTEPFTFEFTPVIKNSFLNDIQKLYRIRLASVSMVRPNMAWGVDASTLVDGNKLEDSEAQRLQIFISAKPNQSLSKSHGFLKDLGTLIRQGVTSITQAVVKGRESSKSEEVTITLNNHVESTRVTIPRDISGHPASTDVLANLDKLIK